MSDSYQVTVNYNLVVAASITSTAAAAFTILTTNHLVRELLISNSLNQPVVLTYNGAPWIALPTGASGAMDGIRIFIPTDTVIGAYYYSAAPTTGFISMSGI